MATYSFLHLFALLASVTRSTTAPGAGSAGASTAYFLRKYASPCQPLNITIFERSDYVGGRSTTVDVYGDPEEPVELGASIFVEVNRNLVAAAKELDLEIKAKSSSSSNKPAESSDELGVWDGTKFVFVQPKGEETWKTVFKLGWRYGLAPFRSYALMKKTVGQFLKLYEEPHFPFRSLTAAAERLSLLEATSQYGEQFLAANSIGPPFSTDFIQASTRVNYGQNLNQIHGLEAMVCIATEGAMAVEGGNWRIFDGMIKLSEAHLRLDTAVTAISDSSDFGFELSHTSASNSNSAVVQVDETLYDDVVIAAPLHLADLELRTSAKGIILPPKVDYVKLHVTLFTSPYTLSPSYFGLDPQTPPPDTILTTLPNDSSGDSNNNKASPPPPPFNSISTLRSVRNPSQNNRREYLYKIFSHAPLKPTLLADIFAFPKPPSNSTSNSKSNSTISSLASIPQEHISWSYEKAWDAYPYLEPIVDFDGAPPLLLEEDDTSPADTPTHANANANANANADAGQRRRRLWYTAGIEPFISTMETSSLSGMNVARWIVEMHEEDGGRR